MQHASCQQTSVVDTLGWARAGGEVAEGKRTPEVNVGCQQTVCFAHDDAPPSSGGCLLRGPGVRGKATKKSLVSSVLAEQLAADALEEVNRGPIRIDLTHHAATAWASHPYLPGEKSAKWRPSRALGRSYHVIALKRK